MSIMYIMIRLTRGNTGFKLEGEDLIMGKKKKHSAEILGIPISGDGGLGSHVKGGGMSFSEFISDPPISTTLLVIGLITLVLSILEFAQALNY